MTVTTPAVVLEDYVAPIRLAAALVRAHWSADAEQHGVHIEFADDADRPDPVVPATAVTLSGLGALVLAHHCGADGLPYEPIEWDTEPTEGFTGYHGIPLVALYLVANDMAAADRYLTTCTITPWCAEADRSAEQIAEMLEAAADAVAAGTLEIGCTECDARFGWDAALDHQEWADELLVTEYGPAWMIGHDARAVCPEQDDHHSKARDRMLAGTRTLLFAASHGAGGWR